MTGPHYVAAIMPVRYTHICGGRKRAARVSTILEVRVPDPVIASQVVPGQTLSHAPTRTPGDQAELDAARRIELAGGGDRFTILRPHAEGGLGKVFVARDEELHRE